MQLLSPILGFGIHFNSLVLLFAGLPHLHL